MLVLSAKFLTFPWKAPWMRYIYHMSLYMYPSITCKIPYRIQDLHLHGRFLPFSRKVSSWIHSLACKSVYMISSIVLTFVKSLPGRYPVCPCNPQITLLYFLEMAVSGYPRIFFHMTLSIYHSILYILQDPVCPRSMSLVFLEFSSNSAIHDL